MGQGVCVLFGRVVTKNFRWNRRVELELELGLGLDFGQSAPPRTERTSAAEIPPGARCWLSIKISRQLLCYRVTERRTKPSHEAKLNSGLRSPNPAFRRGLEEMIGLSGCKDTLCFFSKRQSCAQREPGFFYTRTGWGQYS